MCTGSCFRLAKQLIETVTVGTARKKHYKSLSSNKHLNANLFVTRVVFFTHSVFSECHRNVLRNKCVLIEKFKFREMEKRLSIYLKSSVCIQTDNQIVKLMWTFVTNDNYNNDNDRFSYTERWTMQRTAVNSYEHMRVVCACVCVLTVCIAIIFIKCPWTVATRYAKSVRDIKLKLKHLTTYSCVCVFRCTTWMALTNKTIKLKRTHNN